MNLIYCFAFFLMIGCTKEPLPPNPCQLPDCSDTIKTKPYTLELVWQKQLRVDGEYTVSDPQIFAGKYIVFPYDAVEQEKLLFVDTKDTSSSRFYGPNLGNYLNQFYHPVAGLIAMDYKSVFTGHDAASMKKIASAPDGLQFRANYNLIGDEIFGILDDEGNKHTRIIKLNVLTGDIKNDTIIKDRECPTCKETIVIVPDQTTMPNGDKIRLYNILYTFDEWDKNEQTVEAYLIKEDKKELLWTTNEPRGYKWYLYNGNPVVIARDSIYSFDPYTSDIIWKKLVYGRQYGWGLLCDSIINDNFYCLDQGHVIAINAKNGEITYDSGEIFSPQSNSRFTYFDSVLYWTASKGGYSQIFGMRVSDHKIVLKMKSPNAGKPPYYNDAIYHWRGLSIDPETRLAYTHDGFFAQCFKIPESYD